MIVDLAELLSRCPIRHPSRLVHVDLREDVMTLAIRGYPWWRDPSADLAEDDIAFCFKGISDGWLDLGGLATPRGICAEDNDEVLERFDVQPSAGLAWAQPPSLEVYCHAALPDAYRLYAEVQDHLASLDSLKAARCFLNVPQGRSGSLRGFSGIAANASFLAARIPPCLEDVVCSELLRQGVGFSLLPVPAGDEDRLLVRLNDSWILCRTALADFSLADAGR